MQIGSQKGALYETMVRISSSERVEGGNWSSSNFLYDIGQNLQNVVRISVVEANFFNNFYNITEEGNTFYIKINSDDPELITIPPGRYNITTLMDTITELLSNYAEFTWSIDMVTNYVELTLQTSEIVQSAQIIPPTEADQTFALFYAGFDAKTTLLFNSDTSFTQEAKSFPKLYGPQEVYLCSKALWPSNTTDSKGQYSNCGIGIPITAPYLNLNTWGCRVDSLCSRDYGKSRRLNIIDIQLTDRRNKILDLHGGSLTVVLKMWYNVY